MVLILILIVPAVSAGRVEEEVEVVRTFTAAAAAAAAAATTAVSDRWAFPPSPLYQAIADPFLAHAVDRLLVHQPPPVQLAIFCDGHCYALQRFPPPHPASPLTLLLLLARLPLCPNGRKNVNLIKRRSRGHWVVDSPPVVLLRSPLGPLATGTE